MKTLKGQQLLKTLNVIKSLENATEEFAKINNLLTTANFKSLETYTGQTVKEAKELSFSTISEALLMSLETFTTMEGADADWMLETVKASQQAEIKLIAMIDGYKTENKVDMRGLKNVMKKLSTAMKMNIERLREFLESLETYKLLQNSIVKAMKEAQTN